MSESSNGKDSIQPNRFDNASQTTMFPPARPCPHCGSSGLTIRDAMLSMTAPPPAGGKIALVTAPPTEQKKKVIFVSCTQCGAAGPFAEPNKQDPMMLWNQRTFQHLHHTITIKGSLGETMGVLNLYQDMFAKFFGTIPPEEEQPDGEDTESAD